MKKSAAEKVGNEKGTNKKEGQKAKKKVTFNDSYFKEDKVSKTRKPQRKQSRSSIQCRKETIKDKEETNIEDRGNNIAKKIAKPITNLKRKHFLPRAISLNFFYLLARFGDSLELIPEDHQFSEMYWYFVPMNMTLALKKITSNQKAQSILKMIGSLNEEVTVHDVREKMKRIAVKDIKDELKVEWRNFLMFRDHIRMRAGREAIDRWIEFYTVLVTADSKKNIAFQGPIWKTNSCALDSVLVFFPFIIFNVLQNGESGEEKRQSIEYSTTKLRTKILYFSSVPSICGTLDLLRTRPPAEESSNWSRDIFVDYADRRNLLIHKKKSPIDWRSSNKSNPFNFLDDTLHEAFMMIDVNSTNEGMGLITSVPGSTCTDLFNKIIKRENSGSKFNFPDFLISSFLKYWEGNSKGRSFCFSGLICFRLCFPQNGQFEDYFHDYCLPGDSSLRWESKGSNEVRCGENLYTVSSSLRILLFCGNSKRTKDHFVSAALLHPSNVFLYHDGLERDGMVSTISKHELFRESIFLHNMNVICQLTQSKEPLHAKIQSETNIIG